MNDPQCCLSLLRLRLPSRLRLQLLREKCLSQSFLRMMVEQRPGEPQNGLAGGHGGRSAAGEGSPPASVADTTATRECAVTPVVDTCWLTSSVRVDDGDRDRVGILVARPAVVESGEDGVLGFRTRLEALLPPETSTFAIRSAPFSRRGSAETEHWAVVMLFPSAEGTEHALSSITATMGEPGSTTWDFILARNLHDVPVAQLIDSLCNISDRPALAAYANGVDWWGTPIRPVQQ